MNTSAPNRMTPALANSTVASRSVASWLSASSETSRTYRPRKARKATTVQPTRPGQRREPAEQQARQGDRRRGAADQLELRSGGHAADVAARAVRGVAGGVDVGRGPPSVSDGAMRRGQSSLSAPDLDRATIDEAVKLITSVSRNSTSPAAIRAERPNSLASP